MGKKYYLRVQSNSNSKLNKRREQGGRGKGVSTEVKSVSE